MRVDAEYPLARHVGFVPADIGGECDNLAVDVGGRDTVVVKEVDSSYAASGEYFHGVSAHTAHAEYGHTAAREAMEGLRSQQHTCAGKQFLCLLAMVHSIC